MNLFSLGPRNKIALEVCNVRLVSLPNSLPSLFQKNDKLGSS